MDEPREVDVTKPEAFWRAWGLHGLLRIIWKPEQGGVSVGRTLQTGRTADLNTKVSSTPQVDAKVKKGRKT